MSFSAPPSSVLKVLFVAYFYPPSESTGVPGSLRTVKFVRSLNEVESHVLTTTKRVSAGQDALSHLPLPVNGETIYRISPWDLFKSLLSIRAMFRPRKKQSQQASPAQTVFRTDVQNDPGAKDRFQRLKDFIYDACYFPDQAGPWLIPAFLRGLGVVRKQNIDVVFATGSPWSGLVVGYWISRISRRPLVVDFRDPWIGNPFHQSKGTLLDNASKKLESAIVRHASAISLNTPPLLEQFAERYPAHKHKMFVMPNGYDTADFAELTPSPRFAAEKSMVLCHAGFLYGVRDPAVVLRAIRSANRSLASLGKQVVFHQIGDIQLAYDLTKEFKDLVDDGALKIDPPKPYRECLNALASADVVVNVQPGTKTQVPSKLYDYLAIRKPIINITPSDGALGKLVRSGGLGELFDFDDESRLTQSLIDMAKSENYRSFSGYPTAEQFEITNISADLFNKLNEVSTHALRIQE